MREPEHPEQMKIPIEIVQVEAKTLLDHDEAEALIKAITDAAEAEAEADKASREPAVKKQFVVVLYAHGSELMDYLNRYGDFSASILQLPEDDDAGTALDRVIRASWEYNLSKKGRRHPVRSIGEACEAVGARFLKEQNVAVRTKLPVRVLVSNNALPEVASDFKEAV